MTFEPEGLSLLLIECSRDLTKEEWRGLPAKLPPKSCAFIITYVDKKKDIYNVAIPVNIATTTPTEPTPCLKDLYERKEMTEYPKGEIYQKEIHINYD